MRLLPPLFTALLGIVLNAAHGETVPAFHPHGFRPARTRQQLRGLGDMDNNGRPDLVLTGTDAAFTPRAQVWRNEGNNQFTNATAGSPGLPPASSGPAVWGDYDNDGYWDFLLTGFSGLDSGGVPVLIAQVWRNLGNGNFVNANAGLPGTDNDAAAWADFDNDGDLDILLTGHSRNGAIAQIWRNDGPAGFFNIIAGFTGVFYSSVAVADFDNDGRIDILTSGTTNGFINGAVTQVRRNLGGNVFTNINAGLPGVSQGAVAWGDFDNDTRLDIMVTGYATAGAIAQSGGTWVMAPLPTNSGLPGVSQGGVATGDFDNDGNLDVLLSGVDAGGAVVCEVWRNQGGGTFSNFATDLPGVKAGALAWADFNNDGRLDILLAGFDADNYPIGRLYQNHTPLEHRQTAGIRRDAT